MMSDLTAAHLAIAEAVKESVKTGDVGLLDAAIADYQQLITRLASTHQFSSLKVALDVVSHAVKVSELINRKDTLSPTIFGKVLTIADFHFRSLESKRDASDHRYYQRPPDLPPNAGQSLIIAKAFTVARKDDLNELMMGIHYFAKMGHHQALGVLLEHYFSTGIQARDETAAMFTQLAQLKIDNTLQASITKVLKSHSSAFLDCVQKACVRIKEKQAGQRHYSESLFTLPLIEAFHDAGFQEHAMAMATTYASILPVNGSGEVTCLAHRLRRLGVDHNGLVFKSRTTLTQYFSAETSPAWMEDLLTNPAITIEKMAAELSSINFKTYRENKGFEACEAVLVFAKAYGEKFGLDYNLILEKAAALCSIEIHDRKMQHDPDALKRILADFKFPSEMIFKVKLLKGALLENELGL
jgi:hypothetical protein